MSKFINDIKTPKISVVICAHNPKNHIFSAVLDAIKRQTLPPNCWELIIVDNLSKIPISMQCETSWHQNSFIYVEPKLGLSHARLRGIKEAKSSLIVFVDDDNILNENYLREALDFHTANPQVGCFGGKSIAEYETEPPSWFFETGINLGCQDYGDNLYISDYKYSDFKIQEYPQFAPIGTGMVIVKQAFLEYVKEAENDLMRLELGRKGNALTSGEDNDIVLTIVEKGYEIAYLPTLQIKHLIPTTRLSIKYLLRMAYESNRSWVKVLEIHRINPWKKIPSWTLPLRNLKAYFKIKPWKSELNSVQYWAAMGKFKGQSEI